MPKTTRSSKALSPPSPRLHRTTRRDAAGDLGQELHAVDGLRHMAVHAGLVALGDIVRESVGGQRHDDGARHRTRHGAKDARRLQAVHHRHVHVHQDGVERLAARRRHGRLHRPGAVLHRRDAVAGLLQQRDRQQAVHLHILHHQDAQGLRRRSGRGRRGRGGHGRR